MTDAARGRLRRALLGPRGVRRAAAAVTSSRADPFLPLTVPPRSSPRPIQCESMLEMYVQKAIDVINTDYTPDVLCAEAKLCPGDEPSGADEARVACAS